MAIVGNGELAEDVRREIDRLGAADRVRWFEFRGGVGRYLAALDVFALSSAWEAFPLSVLEAMSCGLPVVATDVGGVGEAVSDGVSGRLVAPGDTEAFAAALEELLGDASLRATMGERGRADYERRYRRGPDDRRGGRALRGADGGGRGDGPALLGRDRHQGQAGRSARDARRASPRPIRRRTR